MFRRDDVIVLDLRELEKQRDGQLLARAEREGRSVGRKYPSAWYRVLEELLRRQNQSTQTAATRAEQVLGELGEALKDVEREMEDTTKDFQSLSRHPVTGEAIEPRRKGWYSPFRAVVIGFLFTVDLVATSTMVRFIFDIPMFWSVVAAIGVVASVAFGVETLMEEFRPLGPGAKKPTAVRLIAAVSLLLVVIAAASLAWVRALVVVRFLPVPAAPVVAFFVFFSLGLAGVAGSLIHRYLSERTLVKPLLDLAEQLQSMQERHDRLERDRVQLLEWMVDLPAWHRQRVDLLLSVSLTACDEGYQRRGGCFRALRQKRGEERPRPWGGDRDAWPKELKQALDDAEKLAAELESNYAAYREELEERRARVPGSVAAVSDAEYRDVTDGERASLPEDEKEEGRG